MTQRSTLTKKAMLVSFGISSWSARKYDRKASEEVAANHNAAADMGRYNKRLLPGDAPSYKAVTLIASRARQDHYDQTLPWSDEGCRLLPAANFLEYSSRMRQHKADFDAAVASFVADYPALQAAAQGLLNGLYNAEDYPAPDDIAGRFGFVMRFLPMPDAADFRVTLGDEAEAEIKAQIEQDTQLAVQDAMSDLWARLANCVDHMVERLSTPDAVFRGSLISNLQEIVNLIPRLNVTGDKTLTDLAARVQAELLAADAQTLRDDKDTRAVIAEKAVRIQSEFDAYFGAPAPAPAPAAEPEPEPERKGKGKGKGKGKAADASALASKVNSIAADMGALFGGE